MVEHRYFLDGTLSGGDMQELAPPPWARSLPADIRYLYDVIEVALPRLQADGLHFHFTRDAYNLPDYGRHVVSVLLQEERCKVPVYGRHILATIKNLPSTPFLGFRPHRAMGRLEALETFEYARDWYTHLKSVRAQGAARRRAAIRRDPCVVEVPLGYHSQDDVPQISMSERTLDVFFAGQVKHDLPRSDYRHWLSTSKFLARGQLWAELKRLDATGHWTMDMGAVAGTDNVRQAARFSTYSERMMQSRICVAPRGSVAESYRAFEGARAGCLVVANPLPNARQYVDSPILIIDHWRELEGILYKYARNTDLLEEKRAATLAWWQAHVDVRTIGKYVAQQLNQASASILGD